MANRRTEGQKTSGAKKVKKSVVPYRHRKWQRVNWAIVKQVYLFREEELSFNDIAKEFNIHPNHLIEVASRENWKEHRRIYWNKILVKTSEKLGERQAEIRARSIALAERALTCLDNMIKNDSLKGSFSDVEKMIRLIEFLYGGSDSRPDVVGGIESLIKTMGQARAKEHKDVVSEDKRITNGNPDDTE